MSNNPATLPSLFKSLSLFRIALSTYLVGDFFVYYGCCFQDFYGRAGVLPISAMHVVSPEMFVLVPLLQVLERIGVSAVLPVLYPAALLAFAIGYRTRWSNAVVFLFNSYLYWRNPFVLHGADTLAHLMLLWCLFLPMNRYWSVDAALDSQRRDRPHPLLPLLVVQLQVCSVYFFSGLMKSAGGPWREGYALLWALSDNMYGGTPAGLYLVENFPGLLFYANYVVMGFQLSFPLLVFCPWHNEVTRALAIAGAALLHLSFLAFLNIGNFPFISLAALVVLIPDVWIDRIAQWRRARLGRVSIFYEPGCAFCHKVALLLREFLLPARAAVQPASANTEALRLLRDNHSWVVRPSDGGAYLKWRGVTYLVRQSLVLSPLGWLMARAAVAVRLDKLYDCIGSHRQRLASITGVLLPFRTDRKMGRLAVGLCGFLALLGLATNVISVLRVSDPAGYAENSGHLGKLHSAAALMQVAQSWYLFAPNPTHFLQQFKITAQDAEGLTTDLMGRLQGPFLRERADGRGTDFLNHRWLKYISQLSLLTADEKAALGHYLCRRARQQALLRTATLREIHISASKQALERKIATVGTPTLTFYKFDCSLQPD